jgi:hypothetical protein
MNGPGPDHGVGLVEVLELVLGLARQDRAEARIGEVIEERREGLLERDPHGVTIRHVDRLDELEALPEARLGHEALERELDVLCRHLAAVDGRLVVELHALSKEERVDGAVLRGRPSLGEIGEDRKSVGSSARAVREAHQLAVARLDVGVA